MINNPEQLAVMASQRQAQAEQRINDLMFHTAAAVFGGLIANATKDNDGKMLEPEAIKRLAVQAKEYGPFLAESYGFVTLKQREEDGKVIVEN